MLQQSVYSEAQSGFSVIEEEDEEDEDADGTAGATNELPVGFVAAAAQNIARSLTEVVGFCCVSSALIVFAAT